MNYGNPPPPSGDYERPNCRFRCGRGAAWGQPCANGPSPDGQCGGTSECQPVKNRGRFECHRPADQGGPCGDGPNKDGSCSMRHPPCAPRLSLRARRGRVTMQVCGLLVLLLAAGFHFGRGGGAKPPAADPGPLSAKHASFTRGRDCAACHAAHEAGLGGMLKAAFTANDMSAQCAQCHAFGGPADQPHNEKHFTPHGHAQATDCRACHTEHRGAQGNLTPVTDAQCNSCHRVQFAGLTRGHHEFPAKFPHFTRGGIKFNHAKHLLEYFTKPDYAARAAKSCVECHATSPGEHGLRTAGFDATCARCHAEQIPQNDLVVLRLPEPPAPADAAKLGADDATTFMAWFLQRGGTNAPAYGTALHTFLNGLGMDGTASFAKSLDAATKPGAGAALLAGLNAELLTRPAQLWTKRQKFEPSAAKPVSGWYWLEDLFPELRYKPAGHADPVARAWLEFALAAGREPNAPDAKRAADFRDEVTHLRASVGRCVKCHVVTAPPEAPAARELAWRYTGSELRAHTKFSHGAHLGLTRCADCHALDAKADYEGQFASFAATAGVSSFSGIALANCVNCHAPGKVRSDCRLCHEYHRGPALKEMSVAR
ncbi:MAG: hypothetical protein HY301_16940 [Verrucomicrobia bacterium]|nr:hypothetical protein [Verrucomicrobiota bacterium]